MKEETMGMGQRPVQEIREVKPTQFYFRHV